MIVVFNLIQRIQTKTHCHSHGETIIPLVFAIVKIRAGLDVRVIAGKCVMLFLILIRKFNGATF